MNKEDKNKIQKHTPLRTCIGCRTIKAKKQLVRFVCQEKIVFDVNQNLAGRGAYLCPDMDCFLLAMKRKAFQRVLRNKITQDIFDELEGDFQKSLTTIKSKGL